MSDPTHEFLHSFEGGQLDPRAGRIRGTVQLDLEKGKRVEHWLISLDRGVVTATRGSGDAGCVIRTDRATFDGMTEGTVNATAALLRGLAHAEGDIDLLLYIQRLFPSPPPGLHPVAAEGSAR